MTKKAITLNPLMINLLTDEMSVLVVDDHKNAFSHWSDCFMLSRKVRYCTQTVRANRQSQGKLSSKPYRPNRDFLDQTVRANRKPDEIFFTETCTSWQCVLPGFNRVLAGTYSRSESTTTKAFSTSQSAMTELNETKQFITDINNATNFTYNNAYALQTKYGLIY